jgi:hypothetical protein
MALEHPGHHIWHLAAHKRRSVAAEHCLPDRRQASREARLVQLLLLLGKQPAVGMLQLLLRRLLLPRLHLPRLHPPRLHLFRLHLFRLHLRRLHLRRCSWQLPRP